MKLKQTRFQTKLFRAYIFFLVCLVLFSFAVFFLCIRLTTANKQPDTGHEHTEFQFFLTQVDSELRDLDNVSVNINYSNISKNILDKSFDLNISSDMLEEMTDLFIALSGTEWKADQMNLYDTSGHVLPVRTDHHGKKCGFQSVRMDGTCPRAGRL